MGGLSMGMDIIGQLVGAVKGKKDREAQLAAQQQQQQQQAQSASMGRFDTEGGGMMGPTLGLPQLSDPGIGMGTVQTSMMPAPVTEAPMFQPQPVNYGQPQQPQPQQPQQPQQASELTPNNSGGGPPQAPSFNLLGSIMNQNRGPYG